MGLFTDWIAAPVAAPLRSVWRIARNAEHEFYNDERIQRKLLELELRYATGTLDRATYERLEAELLSRRPYPQGSPCSSPASA